ncbi:hypothetical protein Ancab_015114 [Ancistrocladus abbreviatus]
MGSLPRVVEDCFGMLQLYSNGLIHRATDMDLIVSNKFQLREEEGLQSAVEWRDFVFDKRHNLWLRLYKPATADSVDRRRLPVLYYFHGGGFCFGSRTWANFHNSCLRLASYLGALVVSPDYRLAPEHRLPAAIEDGANAVKWLQANSAACDAWLADAADFNKVFIMGDSSGGNIAHHLAVQLGSGSPHVQPVRVRGYILLAPFFGGNLRTKSEIESPTEPMLDLDILDKFWRLSLPIGESRDHPLANPFGPGSPSLEKVGLDPMMVMVGGNEIMRDRVEEYATRLKDIGKDISYVEFKGMHHGFFSFNPNSQEAHQLLQLVKQFMLQH